MISPAKSKKSCSTLEKKMPCSLSHTTTSHGPIQALPAIWRLFPDREVQAFAHKRTGSISHVLHRKNWKWLQINLRFFFVQPIQHGLLFASSFHHDIQVFTCAHSERWLCKNIINLKKCVFLSILSSWGSWGSPRICVHCSSKSTVFTLDRGIVSTRPPWRPWPWTNLGMLLPVAHSSEQNLAPLQTYVWKQATQAFKIHLTAMIWHVGLSWLKPCRDSESNKFLEWQVSIAFCMSMFLSAGWSMLAKHLKPPPCEVDVKPPEHLETIKSKLKIEALTAWSHPDKAGRNVMNHEAIRPVSCKPLSSWDATKYASYFQPIQNGVMWITRAAKWVWENEPHTGVRKGVFIQRTRRLTMNLRPCCLHHHRGKKYMFPVFYQS